MKEVNDKAETIKETMEDILYDVKELEEERDTLSKRVDELESIENSDYVGLDTIRWGLDNGNLAIQQAMEDFITTLKKKYIGVAA